MLTEILSNVLEESITISLVIALVMVARFGLKKSPKVFSYALWGVVLFRLVCPVTLESEYGLIPSFTPTRVEGNFVEMVAPPSYESFAPVEVVAPAPIEGDTLSSSEWVTPVEDIAPVDVVQPAPARVEEKTPIDWNSIGSCIWLIGVVFMLGYGVKEFVVLNKSLVGATRWKDCVYGDNIYLCDYIKSPFVMGILKPKIYIPSNLIGRDLDYIISHEKHHLMRLDHLTRVAGFLALSVHWFNPLVWSAFVLSGKDMELSCDEYVLGSSDDSSVDIRAEYSQALLYFACNLDCRRKLIAITPHAFGESGSTKERIVNIMTYKKTAVWVTVLLAGLVGFTSVALASDKTPVEVQLPEVQVAEIEIINQDFPIISSMSFDVGNKYADIIEIQEIYFDKGGQFPDQYQLYNILGETKTFILGFDVPLEFPTLTRFNDENLYWINLNHEIFEYNFSTQKIRQLDINVSYFEVSSDWLIYGYSVVNSDNLEVDDNLYLYNLNNGTTQIINEYKKENNYDTDKFFYHNYFVKFADDGSDSIVFFTEDSLSLYNPNTNAIEYEYSINFDELSPIKSVAVSGDIIEIICNEHLYTIDRATNTSNLIEIIPENADKLHDFMYSIQDLNLTVLNQNNTPITNANVIVTPLYVTDIAYDSYFVTDNNGVAVGKTNEMFPTGEYKIEAWITAENGYEKAYVNQKITSTNYENLVVTMPTTSENKSKYLSSNRTDIYIVDIDENPVANALVELKPTFPIPAMGSMYGFDSFNQFAYTDNDGRATFTGLIEDDYMMNYWYGSAFPGSALITPTGGIDEHVFHALYE